VKIISRKQVGEFTLEQYSKKQYRLIYTGKANRAISMTGSAVTKDFDVEFAFALKRLHLNHHTSTLKTYSTDELILVLSRPQVHNVDGFDDPFYRKSDITVSKIIVSWEDLGDEGGLVFEPSTIRISLNSTNTDLVQPIFYIKRLD